MTETELCNCKKKPVDYGKRINALLDSAFSVLQHDTGETNYEWHDQRDHLAKLFKKDLKK